MLNNKKLKRLRPMILIGLSGLLSPTAYASSEAMLDLLKILHDKGSLSGTEYELLRNAALADGERIEGAVTEIRTEVETARREVAQVQPASGWQDRVSLKGDIRLRFEHSAEDGSAVDRERGRLRYRLGVIAQPFDGWEAGAGLASGGSDLRSTNQSFTDSFSTKGINLDYAYAQYRFNDRISAIGGKLLFKNYLYTATDLMWDSDINPEGFSTSFNLPNDFGGAFANGGIWVLKENSGSDDDPFMYYLQIGQNFGSGNVFGTIAGTYYNFAENNKLGDFATDGSNTDYRFGGLYGLSGEMGVKDLAGTGIKASLVADAVWNTDTITDRDSGYSIGFKASRGDWSFKYIYADLDANAWPDILPDSDRFDGLTGIDGHEFVIDYALMKNVTLSLDYYNVDQGDVNQDLLQADVVVKF